MVKELMNHNHNTLEAITWSYSKTKTACTRPFFSFSPREWPSSGSGAAADGVVGDFLDEDGGGENLEGGTDKVLGGLRVAEADHEPLETRLAVCVAEEHNALHQAKLVEEAPEHHLLLPHVGEVPTLQQDLVRNRDLK